MMLSTWLAISTVQAQVSRHYSGTVTHMPPELIEEGKIYQQGDVYAFGIMMWEVSCQDIIAGRVRWAARVSRQGLGHFLALHLSSLQSGVPRGLASPSGHLTPDWVTEMWLKPP
jgi:hypothetical protein